MMHSDEQMIGNSQAWQQAETRGEVIDLAAWRRRQAPESGRPLSSAPRQDGISAEIVMFRPRSDVPGSCDILSRTATRIETVTRGENVTGIEAMQSILNDMRRELDTLETAAQTGYLPRPAILPPTTRPSSGRGDAGLPRWLMEHFLRETPRR
ncbi:MAG TPA: hypothetical protein VM639_12625 [Dongiaceae bacterium]|nr:hypothetical protein [Dongiaceae bacterium]